MVVFSCDACGDSLRKKDVQKHYQFNCRRCESLTCVDCKKQFWGDDYATHTQCITDEDFKYGLVNQHKDDKGQMKQNQWRSNIDVLLSDRKTDKRWTPILLEMQKYENVPRKKKPFMNWCKCTMKRFPFKEVEEIFDKLLEMHTKAQQNSQAANGKSANDNEVTESLMEVDKKSEKNKKRKGNDSNGNVENSNVNIDTVNSKKKRKKADTIDNNEEMDQDEEEEEEKPKKRSKLTESKDDNSDSKELKFKLKKCVVHILLAKQEPVKLKRIIKKVLAEYSEFLEEREASGTKGKTWSQNDVSSKVEKLVANNKLFKEANGVVQLSPAGKAKYASQDANEAESD